MIHYLELTDVEHTHLMIALASYNLTTSLEISARDTASCTDDAKTLETLITLANKVRNA